MPISTFLLDKLLFIDLRNILSAVNLISYFNTLSGAKSVGGNITFKTD